MRSGLTSSIDSSCGSSTVAHSSSGIFCTWVRASSNVVRTTPLSFQVFSWR
jgi:hypothetical protein